ncbi:sigma-54-dependent Fis family transcriptional regulator [Rheinheimera sp. YQF-2]|uniref:Sigma-54-dependent Fis family transcriptional regulator n=1 Tax=Rheinheimera lutimaris TaxID=2740584 RepID=A0A7Y5EHD1_9GAMM|nr:sigma-54 dependent transcriptional regulator [Rheinheimera lutimaris]NRQ42299.1 sigma-54-dependent Fis family transcriptional regulator [Rheinheimera lutimaris]
MSQCILLVEDDAGLREALSDTLQLANYQLCAVSSAEEALLCLQQQSVQLVISDVQMGAVSGFTLLKTLRSQYPQIPVLMMTAYATVQAAVEAIRLGAIDYLAKPFSPEVLLSTVSRYVAQEAVANIEPVVAAPASKQLLALCARVARTDASVMISGPSGSGKEVLARYIHQLSARNSGPFVAINCAAIPENMLESTLFGYEKGAFTGAVNACPGKFEQAQQGTLLLDEITEMDLNLQAKLLRVLQEREVERLGGRKTIKLDVRILATSNRNLKQAVAQGEFREDLFYRLNVFPLVWPALCERPEDIVPLAQHLLQRHCHHNGRSQVILTPAAAQRLQRYSWPGNVRELDNVMQRALIIAAGDEIDVDDIMLEQADMLPPAREPALAAAARFDVDSLTEDDADEGNDDSGGAFKASVHEQEHRIILAAMKACANRRKEVAEKLGISDRTLRYKLARMREHGIDLPA